MCFNYFHFILSKTHQFFKQMLVYFDNCLCHDFFIFIFHIQLFFVCSLLLFFVPTLVLLLVVFVFCLRFCSSCPQLFHYLLACYLLLGTGYFFAWHSLLLNFCQGWRKDSSMSCSPPSFTAIPADAQAHLRKFLHLFFLLMFSTLELKTGHVKSLPSSSVLHSACCLPL